MERYTHIIWDFNGTVYDDVDACIRSANRLLAAHGLKIIENVADYRSLFGFPIADYYVRMGFDFSKTPYAELAVEWVDYYMEETRDCTVYPGALEAMRWFASHGLSQILLSATERGMLAGQVKSLGLEGCFDEVLGQDTIHAYGKGEIGRAWKLAHPQAEILLIGDTVHDAEVARLMGADFALLTCGHQSRKLLESCGGEGVFDTHADIVVWLEQYGQEAGRV